MNIAIIPARGGKSTQKNIKHFLGKPIISYPIKSNKINYLIECLCLRMIKRLQKYLGLWS